MEKPTTTATTNDDDDEKKRRIDDIEANICLHGCYP